MKICVHCKKSYPIRDFNKQKNAKDGLTPYCRTCANKKSREWYHKNKNRAKMSSREWHEKNPEYRKAYHLKHRNRLNKLKRIWYAKNLEECRVKRKQYYQNNKDSYKVYVNTRRSLLKNAEGNFSPQEFFNLCDSFDNVCLCCGIKENLTIDHVIPLSKGGTNSIENVQPLCLFCNQVKGTKQIDYRHLIRINGALLL